MHVDLFEAALDVKPPWSVAEVRFDEANKVLTVGIDFSADSRFAVEGSVGEHPVHDAATKTYRHLNFFQHECVLHVRTPRVRLPDGRVALVKPPFAGKLSGFTHLFEALVLILAQQMPYDAVSPYEAVARIAGISANQALAICQRYKPLAIDETPFAEAGSAFNPFAGSIWHL
jgi:hypothetical protein